MTFSGFPTIAYVSGRPSTECPKTPETTRGLAASTAATYSSDSAEVTSWEPRSKPRTSFPVGTSPRKAGGVNGSQVGAAPTERVVPATTTTAHAKSVASAKESLPPKRRGILTAFERGFQREAGAENERILAGRGDSETDAGSPFSAAPHGSARAGQPSTLNGSVKRSTLGRSSRSARDREGATVPIVGTTRRSKPSRASRASSRYRSRAATLSS